VFVVDDDFSRARSFCPASYRRPDLTWPRWLGGGISGIRKARFAGLPRPRPGTPRYEWPGTAAGAGCRHCASDHFHHRSRRCPVIRARHEGRRDRVPVEPFDDEELLRAVDAAIPWIEARASADPSSRNCKSIMRFLRRASAKSSAGNAGLANKQTAAELGTSEITIGFIGARSCAKWVRDRSRNW